MKILYTSKTPLAGVCEKMCRTINKYFGGEHEARVLNKGPGKHRWYCRDPKKLVPAYRVDNKDHVSECLEWADVIHCMANVGVVFFGREDLLRKKTWVYQWHGAQIWPFERVWLPRHYPHVRFLHIGQGWVESAQDQSKFFKPFFEQHGAIVVPNVITGDDPLHTPLPWSKRHRCPVVGFAPSQRNDGAVNKKGVGLVKRESGGVRVDLICGLAFEDCLKRKQKCKLGIDEVVTPMYHLSGLEFLAQGTPCICSYTSETERILKDATGSDRMPFINAKGKTLNGKLRAWADLGTADRELMGKEAREWFDEFYHPRLIIEKYLDVYCRG